MIDRLAIVIVTYKRQHLLEELLASLLLLDEAPWRVFVVDNENARETAELVEVYRRIVDEGLTAAVWPDGGDALEYVPMKTNTGGSGGFSEGVCRAYRAGAEWFWLMDDDVVVMPDAIGKLARWTAEFDVVQGARLDWDGGPFFWQHHFIESMGMYDPLSASRPTEAGFRPMNAVCFEGGLFNRRIVETIGPPDARFFIYWDDCVYGYLASKHGRAAVVDDVVLKRTREVPNWEVTGVRQLNASSNMTRYHVMRNRGHMAHYLKENGDFRPVMFGAGTFACLAKELIRLAVVDRGDLKGGASALLRGWRDARAIMADASWRPMGPADLAEGGRA